MPTATRASHWKRSASPHALHPLKPHKPLECIFLYAPVNIALSPFMFNALNNYFNFLFSILNKIPLRQKVATLVVRINLLTSPILM